MGCKSGVDKEAVRSPPTGWNPEKPSYLSICVAQRFCLPYFNYSLTLPGYFISGSKEETATNESAVSSSDITVTELKVTSND